MQRLAARRWPVRTILIAIAVVLVVPGLIFEALLLRQYAEADRADDQAALLSTSARITEAVDRELAGLIATARVLATLPALQSEQPEDFAAAARAVLTVLGQPVFLAAAGGEVLVNIGGSIGPALTAPAAAAALRDAVAHRRPVVSDLFDSTGSPRVAVLAPVIAGARLIAVVGIAVEPSSFASILRDQGLPEGWRASLRDSNGQLLARNKTVIGDIGSRVDHLTGPSGPVTRTVTASDGTPFQVAVAATKAARWRVGVGVPIGVLEQSMRRSVAVLGASGLATLLLAGILAWHLARVISMPLGRLAAAGEDLGAGRAVLPVRSLIGEVADLSRALRRASADLRARSVALASERARLAAIIETVPVGLLIADGPTGRIVTGNRPLQRMLPDLAGAADPTAVTCFDEDGGVVEPSALPLTRALAGEDPAELRCRMRRADATLGWIQSVAAPIRGDDGQVTGAVLALLDIDEVVRAREQKARWAERLEQEVASRTVDLEHANQRLRDEISARNRAEDHLRQAQKMEAVGQLTGGIAHDFNNLLTVILGSLDLLRRRVQDPALFRFVDNALEGANRAASLTASLLAFSRRQPLIPQPVDVNHLVETMSSLLTRTLGETIKIETALDPAVWPALTDPNQLESALLNLAVNARDAILEASPEGGTLRLETCNMSVDDIYAAQVPDARSGDYVVVATTDTGTGMPPDIATRVFEPFFTTKQSGRGTGLGLSQVHGFVVQSGGHVTIRTQPGLGTTVRLFLPRLREPLRVDRVPPAPRNHLPARPGTTILLVEDDLAVRQFTSEALRDLGYVVVEADGGETALAALAAHPEIGLLFSDVVMPGMSGRDLAERVRRDRPDLPVLLTSGYSPRGADPARDAAWAMLSKPFTLPALATRIVEILK